MKTLLLIMVAACCMLACTKSEQPSPVLPGLFGKWELRRQAGSIVGFDSTYKAGNGRIYQFNSDSTYKKFNKGAVIAQGTFHIIQSNLPYANSVDKIVFDHSDAEVFTFSGLQLSIGENNNDGIEFDYSKIQNE
ncbi:MAG: hypothetical protein JWP37_746 [Mucilaginibacter sp.]|nr:hypothetical protein [Mucilaginibacter sp.]